MLFKFSFVLLLVVVLSFVLFCFSAYCIGLAVAADLFGGLFNLVFCGLVLGFDFLGFGFVILRFGI